MKTAYEQGRLVLLQNLDPSLSSSEVQKMHSSGKHNGATTARLQNGLHFRDAVGRKRMGDCHELGMEDLTLLEEEMDKAAKVVHERKILDDDGIAAPGEILRPYDIYINKQSPIDTRTPKIGPANLPDSAYRSNAQSFNDNGGEVVDRVVLCSDKDNNMCIKFLIRHTRMPEIWNHEKAILLNSFDNHDFPDEGIPKLCLVNELDDSLLLDASSDGNIQIWKDYTLKGKQKLVTAFSLIHGHKPGMRSLNAVVDWQQQCGYLCLSVGKPHLCMMWFVLVILMSALVILA
ncbi:hypothetical protein JHK82_031506 [Glycine max]|uniref:Regulatory-associated protein of TOR 1 n=1 Tax=Glycine soja TaxID=3848 RepID=A0A445I3H6_GLYSO|nr:hypothetical protein JHK85_032158 [Glycine max]KAG4994764.1 hypothetical protein JHK86_031591 [Glycine max]KAG5124769.1 hypothetical protein JHK82_031506 [Glycine max]RZB80700.1 Regulatory-associated protein of TOR 1 [Glycine soja]